MTAKTIFVRSVGAAVATVALTAPGVALARHSAQFEPSLAPLVQGGGTKTFSFKYTWCNPSNPGRAFITLNQTYAESRSGPPRFNMFDHYSFVAAGFGKGEHDSLTIGGPSAKEGVIVPPGHHRAYLTVLGEGPGVSCPTTHEQDPVTDSMEWDEVWPAKPYPDTTIAVSGRTTRLSISAFNPNLKPRVGGSAADRRRGWPIGPSAGLIHFPKLSFRLTGAGVNKTVTYNPDKSFTGAVVTIHPTKGGFITVRSSGDHYQSRTTQIQVLGSLTR